MEPEIAAAWIGVGAGVPALILAYFADRRAKKSADAAETANKIAADALREARVANKLAEDANRLGEQANTVLEVQAAREVEEWNVRWIPDWDAEDAVLIIRNKGSHPALDVTVLVHCKGMDGVDDRFECVPKNTKVDLPLPKIAEQRHDHLGHAGRSSRELRELSITITWRTRLGTLKVEELKKVVS